MPLQLTGRHMNISEEMKDYINKKVDRLRRLSPKIDEMSFTLTKEKLEFLAEGKFRAGRIVAQAKTRGSQPLEVIDVLVDKLELQVSNAKEKIDDRKKPHRENPRTALAHAAIQDESFEDLDDEEAGKKAV